MLRGATGALAMLLMVACADGGAEGPNLCGGDGSLVGAAPGTPCGPCLDGTMVCDESGLGTVCRGTKPLNACGGCAALDAELGVPCGTCGVVVCDSDDADLTTCEQPAACAPRAPADLVATTDRADDVLLSWTLVEGATAYRVQRDGELIATVEAASYIDSDVDPTLAGPPSLTASTDRSDGVALAWAPSDTFTTSYSYRVSALNAAGESPLSEPATGRRALSAISAYEVARDGAWISSVELASSYLDTDAPHATLSLGAVTLEGSRTSIAMHVADALATASRGRYRVRAITADGPGDASLEVMGDRVAGPLHFLWERSSGIDPTDFAPLPDSDMASYDDTSPPLDGSLRWYRVTLSAADASPVTSVPMSGRRDLRPLPPTTIEASTDSIANVTVSWSAVPDAPTYHLYRAEGEGEWQHVVTLTTLEYVDNVQGVLPSAPVLQASIDLADRVRLSWTPSENPAPRVYRYRVLSENALGVSDPSPEASGYRAPLDIVGYEYARTEKPAWKPVPPEAGTTFDVLDHPHPWIRVDAVSASTATFPDRVQLSGHGSVLESYDTYHVRAVTSGTYRPTSAWVGGKLAHGPLLLQWERSAGTTPEGFAPLPGFTHENEDDDTAPPNGALRWYRLVMSGDNMDPVITDVTGARYALPAAPTNPSASDDDRDRVVVTWDPVDGADHYVVQRNGFGAVQVSGPPYVDNAASPGTIGVPLAISATTDRSDGVALSWTTPNVAPGPLQPYTVVAVNLSGESAGASVTGRRAAPIIDGYVVTRGTTTFDVNETTWFDGNAPLQTVFANMTLSVGFGLNRGFVALATPNAYTPGLTQYKIQGRSAAGALGAQGTVNGRRQAGASTYLWERSLDETTTAYEVLPLTSASGSDANMPSDGSGRWYRVSASAEGALSRTIGPSFGARLAFARVVVGNGYACAVSVDDHPWCWSAGNPSRMTITLAAIDAGGPRMCAIIGSSLRCWSATTSPVAIASLAGASAVAIGDTHTCALIDDAVHCIDASTATPVIIDLPTGIEGLAAGGNDTCARTADAVYCWSGLGSASEVAGPARDIDVGPTHGCAVLTSGELTCWGDAPVAMGSDLVAVAVGNGTTCTIASDGALTCVGAMAFEGDDVLDVSVGHRVCYVTTTHDLHCRSATSEIPLVLP